MSIICEFIDVSKFYGQNLALSDVNFTILQGHFVPLIGPNGAGKTTAIKLLLGCLKANKGNIFLFGERLDRNALNKIGYAPEHLEFPNVSVQTFLKYISSLKAVSHTQAKREIVDLSNWLGMGSKLKSPLHNLSAGMKQKVRLIQALINNPELLILDEPTANLDIFSREILLKKLKELNQDNGTTVLYSTHILSDLNKEYKSIILLKEGKVVHVGPSSLIISDNFQSKFFLKTTDLAKTKKIFENFYEQLEYSISSETGSFILSLKADESSHNSLLKMIFEELSKQAVSITKFSTSNELKTNILYKLREPI